MRTTHVGLLLLALSLSGCGALDGYVHKSHHFPWGQGTVEERHVSTPMERTCENIRFVLKQRGYSIESANIGEEEAQIRGIREGRTVIFDVKDLEEGSRVHLELSQAGSNSEAWALLTDISSMP